MIERIETTQQKRGRTPNNKTITNFHISDELWSTLQPLLRGERPQSFMRQLRAFHLTMEMPPERRSAGGACHPPIERLRSRSNDSPTPSQSHPMILFSQARSRERSTSFKEAIFACAFWWPVFACRDVGARSLLSSRTGGGDRHESTGVTTRARGFGHSHACMTSG
jgi:hypothetical protein